MIRALAWRASCGVTKGPLATMRGDTSSHHTLTLENDLRSPHTLVAQLGDNTRSCNGTANSGQLPHATCSWVLDGCPVPSFKGSSGNVLWWMIPELLPPVDAAAGLLPLPAPAPAPAPADMAACVCFCRRPIPGDLHLAPRPLLEFPRNAGTQPAHLQLYHTRSARKRSRHEPENGALAAAGRVSRSTPEPSKGE